MLASRFSRYANSLRSNEPLANDVIASVAPSIFARGAHESRSERYTYIPTIDVLEGLRKEGFQPFQVVQTRVRTESKREHTKHMIRLRHAGQIQASSEANEIILLNSHDGSSSYQMLAGVFRFVCQNGMVVGDTVGDIRVPHKGDVVGRVIEGAFKVLDSFDVANEQRESMQSLTLKDGEQTAFARAALALRYDEPDAGPVTETQLLTPRRWEDRKSDLWATFNRVQENMVKGGLRGRNAKGRASTTRPVQGIDQNIKLNRALWVLADELRRLRH